MDKLIQNLSITINKKMFVKDPESTELGKNIVQNSILLIDEIGFESFTFRKLGERIQSNESSIYRYFESKHKLLLYLSTWYWSWVEYRLVFATNNISNPLEKLEKAVDVLTQKIEDDDSTKHINESVLNRIIIAEFSKTFLTKEVDQENKDGFFQVYKRVITRVEEMLTELNPKYKFAKTLASSIVEGSLHQHYLKDHFSNLTNLSENICLSEFYKDLIKKTLL